MSDLHLVVPEGIDDPSRPSGGNTYDRRIRDALSVAGWTVVQEEASGTWPRPAADAREALARTLRRTPDGAVVVVDGLVASAAPAELAREAQRLRLVVLVHQPLGVVDAGRRGAERDALAAAGAVVVTSPWTRGWLVDHYRLSREVVHVVEPGVDPAEAAPGTDHGGELLCVGAVTRAKGHDVLVAALAQVADLGWRCRCVGSVALDPGLVAALRARAEESGIGDRVCFTGPRTGAELAHTYAASDLLVVPSRTETYGMVVTEALARGIPVIASDVGGVPGALGRSPDDLRPGLLLPPADAHALASALRCWLGDHGLRHTLRRAARDRRTTLAGWPTTAARLAGVVRGVGAG